MTPQRRGRVTQDVIESVREATDIVELVGQFVTLKRTGASFKGLCPFHTEKTPSFHVRPERNMYYCFGCQRGGDVFSFLMEHDGVSFMEALRMLGERVGIAVETSAPSERHDDLYAAAEAAARWYEEALIGVGDGASRALGEKARAYLDSRGLTRETAEHFRIGAAPEGWDNLARAMQKRGQPQEPLLELGLLARRRSGGPGTDNAYDAFRDRVVFPIQSLSGRVIGFGGRILPGPDADRAPKYLNSPDSPIYHKNKVLYGLAEARASIRRQDSVVITEGYMDYLSLFQAGIQHVVAACGTAFGSAQAALLHRYTHRAYILGDSDPAGRRAAVRAAGLLLEHGFLVHVVELPSGYDPDTFVREYGAEAMRTRLHEAPAYITYMKLLVDRRAGDLAVKEKVVRHILDDLGRVSDPLLLELYTKELCRSFALTEGTVAAALDKRKTSRAPASGPGTGMAAAVEPSVPDTATSVAIQEARRGLLRLGLCNGEWAKRLSEELEPADFGAGIERRLFESLRAAGNEAHWRDQVASSEDDSFGSELELEGPPPGEPEQLFHDYRATLLEARLEHASADLRRRLAEAESRGDEETMARLLADQRALARSRSELRRPTSAP
jgi:DNA primase